MLYATTLFSNGKDRGRKENPAVASQLICTAIVVLPRHDKCKIAFLKYSRQIIHRFAAKVYGTAINFR